MIKLASHFSKSHADVVPNMFLLLCLLESVLKIRCFQLIFVVDEIVLCLEVNSGQKWLKAVLDSAHARNHVIFYVLNMA